MRGLLYFCFRAAIYTLSTYHLEGEALYLEFQQQLIGRVRDFLRQRYGLEPTRIAVDQPPNVRLGEYALPVSFELAKKLRQAPRKIAEEIAAGVGAIPGFEKLEVAGVGYINARLDRRTAARALMGEESIPQLEGASERKILVEHTSINPNKAAHIGHLRNANLGDTFVRVLRAAGSRVDIQNYIDNIGVQVADVVVGFMVLEKIGKSAIEKLAAAAAPRFDYYCWDLYARVSQWYAQDRENLKWRSQTLHDIERGGNEAAEIGELVSNAMIRQHLDTMRRLDIRYDFLPRESDILRLRFWESAFEQMKQKGVLYFETQGKNKGCWVMRRAGSRSETETDVNAEGAGPDEDAKVIVRSNGTVTYVGKDIAYHLWKFGLLGRDFGYQRFYTYPDGHPVWISAETGESDHPHFGGVQAIYNVIDSRQADPQNNVIEAIRGLGYAKQAEDYHHFSYEMVALTPRCAQELGYEVSAEDRKRAFIEVSGRKGFGVKADDLIDNLIAAALKEVESRHPGLDDAQRRDVASQIAIGALRYFLLKFTKSSVIAFDFKEALSFEGETGPYAQYAAVRAASIFRKAGTTPEAVLAGEIDLDFLEGEEADEIWSLWLTAGQLSSVARQCIATAEPAHVAKHAFQLAQQFNNFYHQHHILTEENPARKQFLLATSAIARRSLVQCLDLMGITVPPVM